MALRNGGRDVVGFNNAARWRGARRRACLFAAPSLYLRFATRFLDAPFGMTAYRQRGVEHVSFSCVASIRTTARTRGDVRLCGFGCRGSVNARGLLATRDSHAFRLGGHCFRRCCRYASPYLSCYATCCVRMRAAAKRRHQATAGATRRHGWRRTTPLCGDACSGMRLSVRYQRGSLGGVAALAFLLAYGRVEHLFYSGHRRADYSGCRHFTITGIVIKRSGAWKDGAA
jgi:hypothetical protein